MSRQSLHASEVHSAKNMVELALRNISPNTEETTYIQNQDVQATIALLREAAVQLEEKMTSDEGSDNWFWTAIHQKN